MSSTYLPFVSSGIWTASREVNGRKIALVQNAKLEREDDAEIILKALGITPNKTNLDQYFPTVRSKYRCPTLELLELTSILDPTNPIHKQQQKPVASV